MQCRLWVGCRISVFIDRPTFGNFLSPMFESDDPAHSADRSSHIQQERARSTWNANGNGIGADECFSPTKWMHQNFRRCEGDTDQTFLRAAFGVVSDHSNMCGVPNGQDCDAVLSCGGRQLSQGSF